MYANELIRIGRKPIRAGQIALTRDSNGNLQRIKIEGVTADKQHLYGKGNGTYCPHYLAVRLFGREWRLQLPLQ